MSRNYYRHLIEATATAPAPPSAPIRPLYQNEIAYYKLDETNGQAVDSVNGYNGFLYGGISRGVDGKSVYAYNFNGVDAYLDFPDLDNKIGTNDFTISCWFKTTQLNIFRLIQNRGAGGVKSGFQISQTSNSWANTAIVNDVNDAIVFTSNGTPYNEDDNLWHLASLRFKNSTGTGSFFIDGQHLETLTNSNLIGSSINGESFEIGRSSNNTQYYNGYIDEVSVILEALTDAQISDLYNNGLGTTI